MESGVRIGPQPLSLKTNIQKIRQAAMVILMMVRSPCCVPAFGVPGADDVVMQNCFLYCVGCVLFSKDYSNSSGLLTTSGGSQEVLLRDAQPQAAHPAVKKTRADRCGESQVPGVLGTTMLTSTRESPSLRASALHDGQGNAYQTSLLHTTRPFHSDRAR